VSLELEELLEVSEVEVVVGGVEVVVGVSGVGVGVGAGCSTGGVYPPPVDGP
jgi:hypothetical protein